MGQCNSTLSYTIQDFSIPCLLVGSDGIIEDTNKNACQLLQYEHKDLVGSNINMLMQDNLSYHLQRFNTSGQGKVVKVVDKKGQIFECLINTSVCEDPICSFVIMFQPVVSTSPPYNSYTKQIIRHLNFEIREPLQYITMGLEAFKNKVTVPDQEICSKLLESCKTITNTFDQINELGLVLIKQYNYKCSNCDLANIIHVEENTDFMNMVMCKSLEYVIYMDPIFDTKSILVDKQMLTKAIYFVQLYMCSKCEPFQTLSVTSRQDTTNEFDCKVKVVVSIHKDSNTKKIRWWDNLQISTKLHSNELNMLFVEEVVCNGHGGTISHFRRPDVYGIELVFSTILIEKVCIHSLSSSSIVGTIDSPMSVRRSKSLLEKQEYVVDIVYIDDAQILLKSFTHLAKTQNWSHVTFQDGNKAIEWFKTHKARLILVDKIMPSIDGVQTIAQLKQYNIPIIGVTGDSYEEEKQEMIKAGAKQVLLKPVTVQMINQLIDVYCS